MFCIRVRKTPQTRFELEATKCSFHVQMASGRVFLHFQTHTTLLQKKIREQIKKNLRDQITNFV